MILQMVAATDFFAAIELIADYAPMYWLALPALFECAWRALSQHFLQPEQRSAPPAC